MSLRNDLSSRTQNDSGRISVERILINFDQLETLSVCNYKLQLFLFPTNSNTYSNVYVFKRSPAIITTYPNKTKQNLENS